MKKLLCVLTILAFAVAVLCGCNSDSSEKADTTDTQNVQLQPSLDSTHVSDEPVDIYTKDTEPENVDKNTSVDKADDVVDTDSKSQNKDSSDKNKDSSNKNEDVKEEATTVIEHEAEIDFSQLE